MLEVCKEYKAVVIDWFLDFFSLNSFAIEPFMLQVSVIDFV